MRNRKKPSCSRQQNGPRKRSGCSTCKDAHVKCTEERPQCRRCQRLSLSCHYAFKLLWEEDALQRNIAHGRVGVWSRSGRKATAVPHLPLPGDHKVSPGAVTEVSLQEWRFVDFMPKDFAHGIPQALLEECLDVIPNFMSCDNEGNIVELDPENEQDYHDPLLSGSTPNNHWCDLEGDRSGDDKIAEIGIVTSPTFSDADNDTSSDGSEVGLPLSSSLSSIALISLSSVENQLLDYYVHELSPKCSLSTQQNPYLKVLLPVAYTFEPLRHTLLAAAACQFFHYSGDRQLELQSLNHRAKAIRGLNEHLKVGQMDWESLATMVMFCFRDITDGCEPSWITHLKMGLRMLKNICTSSTVDSGLRNFCEIYFVAHDVMGRTAWTYDVSEVQHYEWARDEHYQEIDSIMGCSRELISLISEASHLAGLVRKGAEDFDTIVSRAAELMNQLHCMRQEPRMDFDDTNTMVQIAEVKRLAAMLYLHDSITSQLSLPAAIASPIYLHEAIIDALRRLPATSGSSLWPLFVLGRSSLSRAEDIAFVLDRLQQLEQSRYLGSVHHARRRIERNIQTRLMLGQSDAFQVLWEGDLPLNDNERWVSLA